MTDVLRSPEAKQRGLFDPGWLDQLFGESTDDRRFEHRSDRLWQAAVLELWLQQHGIS